MWRTIDKPGTGLCVELRMKTAALALGGFGPNVYVEFAELWQLRLHGTPDAAAYTQVSFGYIRDRGYLFVSDNLDDRVGETFHKFPVMAPPDFEHVVIRFVSGSAPQLSVTVGGAEIAVGVITAELPKTLHHAAMAVGMSVAGTTPAVEAWFDELRITR